jgi:hypothetical protein
MATDNRKETVIDLRSTVVLFLGEDTFSARDSYIDLLGNQAPVHKVVALSVKAEYAEWKEMLESSFRLFTAINRQQLAETGLLQSDELRNVPVVIVLRHDGTDRFSELVRAVVESATDQQIADKLEFVTVTDVSRVEELDPKSALIHSAVESIDSAVVRLQTGILAICDYWRGSPIGSDEKVSLALARIAATVTLSEYDLQNSHFGHFRNGVLGAKTFWVGLSTYTADRIDDCAGLIYAGVLRDSIAKVLTANKTSIVGDLKDETYESLLKTVRQSLNGELPAVDTDSWRQLIMRYQTEVAPQIVSQICANVQKESEILTVLECLSARIRCRESAIGASSLAVLVPMVPAIVLANYRWIEMPAAGILAIVMVAWFIIRRKRAIGEGEIISEPRGPEFGGRASTLPAIPYNPILANVLDDLRRELMAKLGTPNNMQDEALSGRSLAGSLMGEKRYSFEQMRKSDEARTAGKVELGKTPRRLLLLALESGKWRTSAECHELVDAQKDTLRKIAAALRREFLAWVWDSEIHRLQDRNFVQEVLYAPPPPANTLSATFCLAPSNWNTAEWPVAVDRCTLMNSIHFLYLVQHTNVHN